jgi:flavodoxin
MRKLVVYDTNFGNTQRIAERVAGELGDGAKAVSVNDIMNSDLDEVSLLFIGSPIVGWKPTEKMQKFLSTLGQGQLKGVSAAAFDTRVKMFISGNGAKKIAAALRKSGATLVSEPIGFFVKGKEGPLFDGELEKAAAWAKSVNPKIQFSGGGKIGGNE